MQMALRRLKRRQAGAMWIAKCLCRRERCSYDPDFGCGIGIPPKEVSTMEEGVIKFVKDGFNGEYSVYSNCADGGNPVWVGRVQRVPDRSTSAKRHLTAQYIWFALRGAGWKPLGPYQSRKTAADALLKN
jgi:hypothetical protein